MIGVAVIEPEDDLAGLGQLVFDLELLQGVDDVPSLPIRLRDVPSPQHGRHAGGLLRTADEESAALFGERLPRVGLDACDLVSRQDDDQIASSQ
jgi:hypothetical protein